MPDRRIIAQDSKNAVHPAMIVYGYDGSFDGLLCCVFESYDKNELPVDILPESVPMPQLLPVKIIGAEAERAKSVQRSIPRRMGPKALNFIRRAFLTCHPKKELYILQFLRLGYRFGPSAMNRLTDEPVHALYAAVNRLSCEANHYMGFIRFSESGGALTAQIEPKNIVLPLIARHFCERYPLEQFLIYDKTHGMVLLNQDRSMQIFGAEDFEQPDPGAEELKFRTLWRLFYDTIEIGERHNPRCCMSHMPKRYWRCMTEFAQEPGSDMSPAPRGIPGR